MPSQRLTPLAVCGSTQVPVWGCPSAHPAPSARMHLLALSLLCSCTVSSTDTRHPPPLLLRGRGSPIAGTEVLRHRSYHHARTLEECLCSRPEPYPGFFAFIADDLGANDFCFLMSTCTGLAALLLHTSRPSTCTPIVRSPCRRSPASGPVPSHPTLRCGRRTLAPFLRPSQTPPLLHDTDDETTT